MQCDGKHSAVGRGNCNLAGRGSLWWPQALSVAETTRCCLIEAASRTCYIAVSPLRDKCCLLIAWLRFPTGFTKRPRAFASTTLCTFAVCFRSASSEPFLCLGASSQSRVSPQSS